MGTSAGAGAYLYTIRLVNALNSTQPIKTFWYSWLSGGDSYLPSNPLSVQVPAGWNYVISVDAPGGGYGIQFQSSKAPLAPGASLDFVFTSRDTPAALAGISSFAAGQIPIGSSAVYSGLLSGTRSEFVVKSVDSFTLAPEPSVIGLAGAGLLLLAACARTRAGTSAS